MYEFNQKTHNLEKDPRRQKKQLFILFLPPFYGSGEKCEWAYEEERKFVRPIGSLLFLRKTDSLEEVDEANVSSFLFPPFCCTVGQKLS